LLVVFRPIMNETLVFMSQYMLYLYLMNPKKEKIKD